MAERRGPPPARREACPEWQGDLAAWVTAQGGPEREAALLAHLEGCAACRAEADGLLAVAAVALVADPDRAAAAGAAPPPSGDVAGFEPPADLGDRISARVRAERRGHLRRRALVAAVGAAAAAAVLVGALVVASDDGPARLEGEEFAFTVLPAGGEAEAVVAPYEEDSESSVVQLTASGLDPDVTYALWLSVPGGGREDRVPAGTFRPEEDGTVDVQLPCGMPAGEVGRLWATTPTGDLALDTQ
jgi:hypothetical protein